MYKQEIHSNNSKQNQFPDIALTILSSITIAPLLTSKDSLIHEELHISNNGGARIFF